VGWKVTELRDASGQVLSRGVQLDYDSAPDIGESEAVLVAWLECNAKVLGISPSHTIFESEGRRVYSLSGELSYHVEKGRIVAIKTRTSTRVRPRGQ
jgi:hypothetical protein